jgi:AcrR family transcriptional regulator
MSPRPYQLGKRRDQIDESRQNVVDAARALLAEVTSYSNSTVDAVAKRADVARATVYYQFESKTGLLEALCDALAEEGQMSDLASAFMNPDPIEGVSTFVSAFGRFWDVDRPVMRRLRSLAALEPEVEAVISARDERRLFGATVLVGKLNDHHVLTCRPGDAARMFFSLTSFETFDTLAGPDRSLTKVAKNVLNLASVLWQK